MKNPHSILFILLTILLLDGCSSNNGTNENPTLPNLTTITVNSVTATTSSSGGNISSDGGSAVTSRGVVWGTNSTPTIDLMTKTTDGTGIGSFSSTITGLTPNTAYYVRAYATNNVGTSYGNEVTFTTPIYLYSYTQSQALIDIDGNSYPTIITNCSNQVWTQKNLNVSRYRNGDVIPEVSTASWPMLTTGAWCYYNNSSSAGTTYGKLYNWYAVNDPRGLAPTGWHIPTNSEWTTLIDCLGGQTVAGGKMKATTVWGVPNTGATNSSGFTGLPGSIRYNVGTFYPIGSYGGWWSSSAESSNTAWTRWLNYNGVNASKSFDVKYEGFSVRCVKD